MTEQEFLDRVRYIAKDEAVDELLKRLKQRYIEHWERTDPNEVTTRDQIYSLVRILGDFRADITTIASGLKVEAFNRRLADRWKAR